jgi:hypothetical protein
MAEPDESKNILGDNGTTDESWHSQLPEDMRENETLKTIPDVSSLAKSFLDTKKMVGSNTIALPGKAATPEQWDTFYKSVGRPDKWEDYQFPTEGLPEGVAVTGDDANLIRSIAHKAGLHPRQAAIVYREYLSFAANAQESATTKNTQTVEAGIEDLKMEYGAAYDERIGMAVKAVKQFGGEKEELAALLNESGLGNHPTVVRTFARIGRLLAEDEIVGKGSGATFSLTPTEAQTEIDKLRISSDFNNAYFDNTHVGHKAAQEQITALYKQVHPEKEVASVA